MAALQTVDPVAPGTVARSAVVWINGQEAIVATMAYEGRITTCEVFRGTSPELGYLAQVVRVIGDRERVVILGPSSARLALEREYVAIYKRPDRLVDVEPSDRVTTDDLVARLRTLAE
jgi:hypothetical protein